MIKIKKHANLKEIKREIFFLILFVKKYVIGKRSIALKFKVDNMKTICLHMIY